MGVILWKWKLVWKWKFRQIFSYFDFPIFCFRWPVQKEPHLNGSSALSPRVPIDLCSNLTSPKSSLNSYLKYQKKNQQLNNHRLPLVTAPAPTQVPDCQTPRTSQTNSTRGSDRTRSSTWRKTSGRRSKRQLKHLFLLHLHLFWNPTKSHQMLICSRKVAILPCLLLDPYHFHPQDLVSQLFVYILQFWVVLTAVKLKRGFFHVLWGK